MPERRFDEGTADLANETQVGCTGDFLLLSCGTFGTGVSSPNHLTVEGRLLRGRSAEFRTRARIRLRCE